MSLKFFHLFFIATSVLLAIGVGTMTLRTFMAERAVAQLGWSSLSFAAAVALIVYGVHIRRKLRNVGLLLAGVYLLGFPRVALACSVCYGDPNAPQTQGMNMAIVFMLIIVATILTLFAAFFVHLRNLATKFATENLESRISTPGREVNVNE